MAWAVAYFSPRSYQSPLDRIRQQYPRFLLSTLLWGWESKNHLTFYFSFTETRKNQIDAKSKLAS
jgi:hypothetical protein